MLADHWSDLTLLGAFVAGLLIGGIAVARITRMVMEWLRRDRRRE